MFRLALALGRTVKELGNEITSSELAEWMAFDELEPFGDAQADRRSAVGHWLFGMAHRSSDSRAPTIQDHLDLITPPDSEEYARRQHDRARTEVKEARLMGRVMSRMSKAFSMKGRSVAARKGGKP